MKQDNLKSAGYIETSKGVFEKPKFLPPVPGEAEVVHVPVDLEGKLHDDIIRWCNSQHPRVKYVHSRMDKRTTTEPGTADFILLLPGGRVFICECKARNEKLSPDQRDWHKEVEMLGHKPVTVWSMEEFLIMVKPKQK